MSALAARSSAYFGEPSLDPLDWLKAGAGAAVATIIAALVSVWRKPSSHAELEKAINEAARGIVADLRTEVDRLQDRLEAVEAQNIQCQGENRQLLQHIMSLEAVLRRSGIPIPANELLRSFVVIEADRATALKPDPKKPEE